MASKRVVQIPLSPDEPYVSFVWGSDTERVQVVAFGQIIASVTYVDLLEAINRLAWKRGDMLLRMREEDADGE